VRSHISFRHDPFSSPFFKKRGLEYINFRDSGLNEAGSIAVLKAIKNANIPLKFFDLSGMYSISSL